MEGAIISILAMLHASAACFNVQCEGTVSPREHVILLIHFLSPTIYISNVH